MALQGDLNSFALPDVLRLLAGTQKSGRLDVVGTSSTGGVVLLDGAIVAGGLSTTSEPISAPEVLFELLRFDDGTFNFDEGPVTETGESTTIDEALESAEALVAEWAEVKTVVPSMEAWVTLVPEIDAESVSISAAQWKALVAVGDGGSVADLASSLGLSALPASQQVKELADAALVAVRQSHAYTPPEVDHAEPEGSIELDSFEAFEPDADTGFSDFQDLVAEDQPVLMEENADSLLPEPLPGAGSVYETDSLVGAVDGRSVDGPSFEADAFVASPEPEPIESFSPDDLVIEDQDFGNSSAADEPEPGSFADLYSQDDPDESARDEFLVGDGEQPGSNTFLGMPINTDEDPTPPAASEAAPAREGDDERGSLLRFLSSVKN